MILEKGDTKIILLVEDDPQDVKLTLAALEGNLLTHEIVVAEDGAEALEYFYREGKYTGRKLGNPVLVLLDNKMPKVNGLEVLKIIKTDESLKTIPVVMLTSSRETQDVADFYENGANAYVVKPLNFGEFMNAVKQLAIFWTLINEAPLQTARA